jgi:hypothetical protein
MSYTVQCLAVGHSEVPGPELFWMQHWDKWFPLTFQVVLVRGNGVVALVNTGPADDLEPMNTGWASFLGERARMHRLDGEFVAEQLAVHGVAPDDVTHVILTPLQLYTVSNVLLFRRAEICISRRGWLHFHSTHDHPHDDRNTSIPPHILTELVTDAWPRVRLLDDEDVIAPGLRTWWAGAHHRASIAVEVDTAAGVAVISDAFFHIENVAEPRPIGICESIAEAHAAYRRAAAADLIVPLYDPKNFERFENGAIP